MRASRLLPLLDRWLGIPLICLLGIFRKKKKTVPDFSHPTIALLNTAAIGDTILISGIIRDLQQEYPRSTITFFTGSSNYQAALLIENVHVVCLPVTRIFLTIRQIRQNRFDLWIDCGQWPRINALYSYFAKADFKIGFQTPGQHRHFVYDRVALHRHRHELDNFRSLVEILGIKKNNPPTIRRAPLIFSPHVKLVLHLKPGGSQARIKEWPARAWVDLIDRLIKKGCRIFLTGSQTERIYCEKIRGQTIAPGSVEIVAGLLSLQQTAELLQEAHCVISVDTGIMHLAAALGCKTIALHGPTSPERWGGVGPHVIALTPPSPYTPFIHLGFEKGDLQFCSMETISPDAVMAAFETMAKEP